MIALDVPFPPEPPADDLRTVREWAARCPPRVPEGDERLLARALRQVRRWAELDREGPPPEGESGDHGPVGRH